VGTAREVEVTFLMADMSGFTALTETHGDMHAANVATRYVEIAEEVLDPGARLNLGIDTHRAAWYSRNQARNRMKRAVMVLVLCVLAAGLVACTVHTDRLFGEDSTAAASHGLGCGFPLTIMTLAATLSIPLLSGRLPSLAGPLRVLGRPASLFQPPERPA
jgi:hypothetical protein